MQNNEEDMRFVIKLSDKVDKLDQRFQSFERDTIERLVKVETNVANIPKLVYHEIKSMLNEKSEGNFKWLANLTIPILTGSLGVAITYILTKVL